MEHKSSCEVLWLGSPHASDDSMLLSTLGGHHDYGIQIHLFKKGALTKMVAQKSSILNHLADL